ncbi:WD repeat-containing protein 54 [Dermatophagoides pteronyssinus]|uniref:WD repeat-containing protein 54 n=1 Tax=Dermatophagoides pteronyssinus TaxID=6956 RepID=A0ABQ8JPP3_DERPT|nr:WD repeat-containing protein 54 [Dermatophagoides pteronyssinus]
MYSQLNPLILRSLTTSACYDNLSIESLDDKSSSSSTTKITTILAVHDNRKIAIIKIDNENDVANIIDSTLIDFSQNSKSNPLQMIKMIRLQNKIYLVVLSSKTLKIYSTESGYKILFEQNIENLDKKLNELTITSIEKLNENVFGFTTRNRLHLFEMTNNNNNGFVEKEFHQDLKSSTTSQIIKFIKIDDQLQRFGLFENFTKITIWQLNEKNFSFTQITTFDLHANTKLTCVQVFKTFLLIGTVAGQIQIVNIKDGLLMGEIQSHIKCVTSMDVATNTGYLISGSEDSYARLFRLEQINENEFRVEFLQQFIAPNEMIFGTKFLNTNGSSMAITTFESNQIKIFKMK